MARLHHIPGAQVLAALPVLPLPNVVLLPGMVLPLNVYEPRYLELVDFVRQTGHHIGVPLQRPADDDDPAPPLEPVLGLGKLVFHVALPDGRRIIRLEGVGRVRVQREWPRSRGFRELSVVPLGEPQPADHEQLQELRAQVEHIAHRCGEDSEALLSLLGLRDERMFLYSLTAFLPSLELLVCDAADDLADECVLVELQQRSLAAADADERARFLLGRTRDIAERLAQQLERHATLLN